ncbi:ADP-ribosyltransferase [Nonomuraea polychroma]|uniref:ADP-ribosyltransferase n=1 Tax=Nonomuraea polychroma TaxID=46176 RepID=UPI003D8C1C97
MPQPDRRRSRARNTHHRRILDAEQQVGQLVRAVVSAYLTAVRAAILPGPVQVVVAAAGDEPPDLGAWPDPAVWQDLVDRRLLPRLETLWGQAFRDAAANAAVSDQRWREAYVAQVRNRLSPSRWPAVVWQEVQFELGEALAAGESAAQITARLAAVLKADAPSRRLRARAAELRRVRDDSGQPADVRAAARRQLTSVYRDLEDADRQWLPHVDAITRTEVSGALVGGTWSAAMARQEAGEPLWKEWLATPDGRTRPSHAAADGQIQRVHEPFHVGDALLQHPVDPDGPPDETISCRCGLNVLTRQMAAELGVADAIDDDGSAAAPSSPGGSYERLAATYTANPTDAQRDLVRKILADDGILQEQLRDDRLTAQEWFTLNDATYLVEAWHTRQETTWWLPIGADHPRARHLAEGSSTDPAFTILYTDEESALAALADQPEPHHLVQVVVPAGVGAAPAGAVTGDPQDRRLLLRRDRALISEPAEPATGDGISRWRAQVQLATDSPPQRSEQERLDRLTNPEPGDHIAVKERLYASYHPDRNLWWGAQRYWSTGPGGRHSVTELRTVRGDMDALEKSHPEAALTVLAMDELAEAWQLPEDVVVYRGMYRVSDVLPDDATGYTLVDHAYMSTSFNLRVTGGYVYIDDSAVIEIRVPAGTSGILHEQILGVGESGNQEELTLPRGTALRIIDDSSRLVDYREYDDDPPMEMRWLTAEVVPSAVSASMTGAAGPGGRPLDPRFKSCAEAARAGYGPYRRGVDPEYAWYWDADKDGVVCDGAAERRARAKPPIPAGPPPSRVPAQQPEARPARPAGPPPQASPVPRPPETPGAAQPMRPSPPPRTVDAQPEQDPPPLARPSAPSPPPARVAQQTPLPATPAAAETDRSRGRFGDDYPPLPGTEKALAAWRATSWGADTRLHRSERAMPGLAGLSRDIRESRADGFRQLDSLFSAWKTNEPVRVYRSYPSEHHLSLDNDSSPVGLVMQVSSYTSGKLSRDDVESELLQELAEDGELDDYEPDLSDWDNDVNPQRRPPAVILQIDVPAGQEAVLPHKLGHPVPQVALPRDSVLVITGSELSTLRYDPAGIGDGEGSGDRRVRVVTARVATVEEYAAYQREQERLRQLPAFTSVDGLSGDAAKRVYRKWLSQDREWTWPETNAADSYRFADSGQPIRDALRAGSTADLTPDQRTIVQQLDHLAESSFTTPTPVTVWRGWSASDPFHGREPVGQRMTDKAYQSWSANRDQAERFLRVADYGGGQPPFTVFRAHLPAGTEGVLLDKGSKARGLGAEADQLQEVMLGRNRTLTVVGRKAAQVPLPTGFGEERLTEVAILDVRMDPVPGEPDYRERSRGGGNGSDSVRPQAPPFADELTASPEVEEARDAQPSELGQAAPFEAVDAAVRDGLPGFTDPYNMLNTVQPDADNRAAFREAKQHVAADLARRVDAMGLSNAEVFSRRDAYGEPEIDRLERQLQRERDGSMFFLRRTSRKFVNGDWVDETYVSALDSRRSLPAGAERIDADAYVAGLREQRMRDLVTQWAALNNDDPAPFALQETARDMFGLDGLADWPVTDETRQKAAQIRQEQGPVLEAFLRAQHEATQEWFARHGITHVRVYRGFRFPQGEGPDWVDDDRPRVPLRPLSSFSIAPQVAETFAFDPRLNNLLIYRDLEGTTEGVAIAGTVPVERILAFPRTGVGSLAEGEVVVLGGTDEWDTVRSPTGVTAATSSPWPRPMSAWVEDWLRMGAWDVRDASGAAIDALADVAAVLGMDEQEAADWVLRSAAGMAAPDRLRAQAENLSVVTAASGPGGRPLDPRFSSCAEARRHGYGPYRRGVDPEYEWYRDADRDGIVCDGGSRSGDRGGGADEPEESTPHERSGGDEPPVGDDADDDPDELRPPQPDFSSSAPGSDQGEGPGLDSDPDGQAAFIAVFDADQVTDEQRAAAVTYQIFGSHSINPSLRASRGDPWPLSPHEQQVVHDLDDLINRSRAPRDTFVWRGMVAGDGLLPEDATGYELRDSAFSSTTWDRRIAEIYAASADDQQGEEPVLIRVRVPEGAPALPLNAVFGNDRNAYEVQQELLLQRHAALKVVGDERRTMFLHDVQGPAFRGFRTGSVRRARVLDVEYIPQEEQPPKLNLQDRGGDRDRFVAAYRDDRVDLGDDERQAVDAYAVDPDAVDGPLRSTGGNVDALAPDEIPQVAALESAIDQWQTPEPTTVYRGVAAPGGLPDEDASGQVVDEPGFMSATWNPDVAVRDAAGDAGAPGTVFELRLPAGESALPVDAVRADASRDAMQVLLQRGRRITVDVDEQRTVDGPDGRQRQVRFVSGSVLPDPDLGSEGGDADDGEDEWGPGPDEQSFLDAYDVQLSDRQRQLVETYETAADPFNEPLRRVRGNVSRLEIFDRERITELTDLVARWRTPHDTVVWRGIANQDGILPEGDAVGYQYRDHGFGSTTWDEGLAEDYADMGGASGRVPAVLEVTVPAGTQALPVNAVTSRGWGYQQELMLQRGHTIQITSDEERDIVTARGDTSRVRHLRGVVVDDGPPDAGPDDEDDDDGTPAYEPPEDAYEPPLYGEAEFTAAYTEPLDTEQLEALADYQDDADTYQVMLRRTGGDIRTIRDDDPELSAYIQLLDEITSWETPQDTTVWRGLLEFDDRQLLPGGDVAGWRLPDAGFGSTTWNRDIAEMFAGLNLPNVHRTVVRVDVPAGTRAFPLGAANFTAEGELLLGRGYVLELLGEMPPPSDAARSDVRWLHARLVPPSEAAGQL